MVCELKITSGCKKMCKNFMVIRHSRVISEKHGNAADQFLEIFSLCVMFLQSYDENLIFIYFIAEAI